MPLTLMIFQCVNFQWLFTYGIGGRFWLFVFSLVFAAIITVYTYMYLPVLYTVNIDGL